MSSFRIDLPPPDTLRQIENEAPSALKAHFDLIKGGLEAIPEVPGEAIYSAVTLRTIAHRPDVFVHLFLTEHYATKQGQVETQTKELLALLISEEIEGNETPACGPYHAGAAHFEGASDDAVALVRDFDNRKHELPDRQRAAIEFGRKAALAPTTVTDADVATLKAHGFTDGELVELTVSGLVAYALAAVNQVFDLREGGG